jgi:hypothetical protein
MAKEAIGALWKKQSSKGVFLSGTVTVEGQNYQIIVFKNDYKKEGEKTPDYRIFKSEPRDGQRSENEEFIDNIPF